MKKLETKIVCKTNTIYVIETTVRTFIRSEDNKKNYEINKNKKQPRFKWIGYNGYTSYKMSVALTSEKVKDKIIKSLIKEFGGIL